MDQKRCTYCGQLKPAETFVSRRKCYDCATNKTCRICGECKSIDEFSQDHGRTCKSCRKTKEAERYRKNKEHIDANNKEWKRQNARYYKPQQVEYRSKRRKLVRDTVLNHYGNKCACCGETEPLFLTIDHVNGDGWKHRRMIGKTDMWQWLYSNNFPDGFQILCYNCNAGRYRNGGVCPHRQK